MKRIAEIDVCADGDELVLRVKAKPALKALLLELLGDAAPATRSGNTHAKHRALTEAQEIDVARRYQVDLDSAPELAAAFNVSTTAIESALERQGVRRRSASEAARANWIRRKRKKAAAAQEGQGCQPKAPPASAKPAPASTAKPKSSTAERDGEIVRLYRDEQLPLSEVMRQAEVDRATALGALERCGVRLRSQGQQMAITRERNKRITAARNEFAAKPKPLHIPDDAPRDRVKISAVRAEIGDPKWHRAYGQRKDKPSSPAEQQAAVAEYFAKGGKITVLESELAPPPAPVKVKARAG
jgi:predicted DNA-binding protein YlxM (UPF0122 family)